MKIENVQLATRRTSESGFESLCTFSLELTPEVKLYGLQLLKAPDGKILVRAPKSMNGSACWSMAPRLREEIASLATAAMQDAFLRGVVRRMEKIAKL
ncbi:hypothetical protein [Pseudaminobacter sp. NGMCC 1.201702]|uniref:hypothetical protein n=1 Tax=Pseudaminobacter sp. NGMCC 1.201702 TaxID=3391825 RepID=UPI0039F02FB3